MFGFWRKKPKLAPAPRGPQAKDYATGTPRTSGNLLTLAEYGLDVSLQTDVGCVRPANQDHGVIIRPTPENSKGILIAVADGMGGHLGGETASQCAIDVIGRLYYEFEGDPAASLSHAFEQANAEIQKTGVEQPELRGMGTTCTALALVQGIAYAAHVGDSRLYMVREGGIYLMTEDHSAVMEMVKQGTLTLAEARHHADKNVITRALGTKPQVEVSLWNEPLPLRVGDRFVLCSDGLYDRIEDSEIRDLVTANGATRACEILVEIAKQRGGYDNITVAVVGLLPAAASLASSAPPTRELEVPL